jgi:hypothetical protein
MSAVTDLITHRARHAKLDALELCLRAQPEHVASAFQPEIYHHWAPGLYAREMRIRTGAVITSKIHKYPGLSILSKGRMALYMEDGGIKEVSAGFHIVASAGTRRAALVMEDAVWTCMHPTELTDLDLIEQHFIAQSMGEFIEWAKAQERIES